MSASSVIEIASSSPSRSAPAQRWHDYKAGKLDRAMFRAWMALVRAQVEAVLERALASGIDHLAGSCANILEHRVAL